MRSFSAKVKGARTGGPKGSPPSLKFHGPNEKRYVAWSVVMHPPLGRARTVKNFLSLSRYFVEFVGETGISGFSPLRA
jgi:hypothetical protein